MEAYGAAKARLFSEYSAQHRIINADDPFGAELIARRLPDTVSYGLTAGDVRGELLAVNASGMELSISYRSEKQTVRTGLIGRFNACNLLAVAATLLARGTSLARVTATLSSLSAAPGRMQRVNSTSPSTEPGVYVDYAHTPDALAKALDALRETKPAALIVVFGCGGDRDRRKRPIMGNIAAEKADRTYVTSDNPRSEVPEAIIAEVVAGISPSQRSAVSEITLRRQAIRTAIANAAHDATVLIAGKGHETYQEIHGVRHPFSDVDEALLALEARRVSTQRPPTGESHVVR
jgi:UDP-N-acetylmuramoyl-L-alanyl-D-glutamate--2,6-diaminopimelate ligase